MKVGKSDFLTDQEIKSVIDAILNEFDRMPADKFEKIQAQLIEDIAAFRITLKQLTKKSADQFIAGLNKFKADDSNRTVYLHFWMDSLNKRFTNPSSEPTRETMRNDVFCNEILWHHVWLNGILGENQKKLIEDNAFWPLIQEYFLEQYSWDTLLDHGSYQLFTIMNVLPDPMKPWFEAYFKVEKALSLIALPGGLPVIPMPTDWIQGPRAKRRIENDILVFTEFLKKYYQAMDKDPTFQLPLPPNYSISYTVDSKYLSNALKLKDLKLMPDTLPIVIENDSQPEFLISQPRDDKNVNLKLGKYRYPDIFTETETTIFRFKEELALPQEHLAVSPELSERPVSVSESDDSDNENGAAELITEEQSTQTENTFPIVAKPVEHSFSGAFFARLPTHQTATVQATPTKESPVIPEGWVYVGNDTSAPDVFTTQAPRNTGSRVNSLFSSPDAFSRIEGAEHFTPSSASPQN